MSAPLDGYKTYLCGFLGLVVVGLQAAGVITDKSAELFLEVLGAGGIMALRRALSANAAISHRNTSLLLQQDVAARPDEPRT